MVWHGDGEPLAERQRDAAGSDHHEIAVGELQSAAVVKPSRQQSGRFERRLDPCLLGRRDVADEVDQISETIR